MRTRSTSRTAIAAAPRGRTVPQRPLSRRRVPHRALLAGLVAVASAQAGAAQSWLTEITSSDGQPYDRFGFAVEADGGRLLVASPYAETLPQMQDVGAAYVFDPGAGPGGWQQTARLDPSDPVNHAGFGSALALHGDLAVVGAPYALQWSNEVGAVYVFDGGAGWVQTQRLVGTPPTDFGEFGQALALDGDVLVVGAPRASGAAGPDGAVFVFRRGASGWVQSAVLHGTPGREPQGFGRSLALDGSTLVVGAPRAYGSAKASGRVYVFEDVGGAWTLRQTLSDPGGVAFDQFGWQVALDGERLAVGVPYRDGDAAQSGAVDVFTRDAQGWSLEAEVTAPTQLPLQRFGYQVEVQASLLLVSSPFSASFASGAGEAWLFGRSGGGWLGLPGPNSPKLSVGDAFGCAAALDEEFAAFGVLGDSDLTPANPGQGSVSIVSLADLPLHGGYCFGTWCPCGNLDESAGCRNSSGAGGRLSATGSLSVRARDLRLHADALPPDHTAFLFVGAQPSWSLAGDGLLCLDGGVHGLHAVGGPRSTGADGSLVLEWWSESAAPMLAGESRFLQLAYRDPAGPCNQSFNASNALALSFVP